MSRTRRRRVFSVPLVLAFSIGFGGGMATIHALAPAAPDRAQTRPVLTSTASWQAESLIPGAFFGAFRRPQPPAEVAVRVREHLEALPDRASVPSERALDGLANDAAFVQEARLTKAALPRAAAATHAITVRRGDTLMDILTRAGIERTDAYAAVTSLRGIYDPRRLRPGQELVITAAHPAGDGAARALHGFSFDLSFEHELHVTRNPDGVFATAKVERPQRRELVLRAGPIDDSLYLAAARAAVPQDLVVELIKLFSWDVDFQRDIRAGDAFETLFEEVSLATDALQVRTGELLYARLALSGRELEAYRFARPDGSVEYFDRTGRSLRKFLLRTPIDGARMSSRFGMRRHPILGYSRMHKGVDFAAPTGTPIYAAGGGRVEAAGRNGGYGNYVRLRHNGEYGTAYAHLSRIGKGIRSGATVRQGQVIGYVGTTGRSTGPHLHYEVLKAGVQINPLTLKHPPNSQLAGAELDTFRAEMARIDRLRQQHDNGTLVASRAPKAEGGSGG